MSIKQSEMSEKTGEKYNLIDTKYIGNVMYLVKTSGEAYMDIPNNQWYYRPTGTNTFHKVSPREIECAADKGWLKGTYNGLRDIPKQGKAYWDESFDSWVYKPKGSQKEYIIAERYFTPVRDEDVFI